MLLIQEFKLFQVFSVPVQGEWKFGGGVGEGDQRKVHEKFPEGLIMRVRGSKQNRK